MYFFGFLLLSFMQYFILSAWNLTKTLPQEGAASLILSCHSHSSVLSFLKIWVDIKLLVTCWHLVSRFFNLCKDFFLTSAALYLQYFLLYILQCFNTVPKVQIFSLGGKKKKSSIFLAKMKSVKETVPSWQMERNRSAVATKKMIDEALVIYYYEYPFAFLGMNVN